MSVEIAAGEVVHYPKRRDVFEFDNEVASLFDNMAQRSIPLYQEVHRMHVAMFEHMFREGAHVVDIGSSTGNLFRHIEYRFNIRLSQMHVRGTAIDISQPMMDRLLEDFPHINGIVGDITAMDDLDTPADIMFALYVLQFVHPDKKVDALQWMVRNLKVGGVLVLGQKEEIDSSAMRELFDDEYYQFRRDNGYTQHEIDAKTAALRNSMWPLPHAQLMALLQMNNLEAVETSRWLHFSTVVAVRRR